MDKPQTIEDFYKSKLNWLPDNLKKEMGHFNVFRLEEFAGHNAKAIPYSRKDYYKISLIVSKGKIDYADKTFNVDEVALLFANPLVPYKWEYLEENPTGFFCIFTEEFFSQFGNIKEYPVFQPGGTPIFSLDTEQKERISAIYTKMLEEISSEYAYKYDVLRTLVFDLIHNAIKMKPAASKLYKGSNAATRIASLFTELLERQFPIESNEQRIKIHTPAEFAEQLAVHVNHLNRALKEVTGKTTSQLIADRIAQEARILLKHTNWNISEISWCLGFEELSHFIKFFKKNSAQTPKMFRET